MTQTPFTLTEATLPALEALLREWGQPAFRARQIHRHIYVKLATSFSEMSDLPLALRQKLEAEVAFSRLKLRETQLAHDGSCKKAAFGLGDGGVIETVLMYYRERSTACISTQAGCAMDCIFCATGKMGFLRNLKQSEMIEQVLWAARETREQAQPLTNLVFMGMGEPFANYDEWWATVERLHDPQGFNFGARRMTVSTAGLVPGIRRLAQEALPVNLSISLHAPTDELRSELMPINRRYPIAEVIDAARDYAESTHRRVSFEYVLIKERNDSSQDAETLAILLNKQPFLCHVNLIPWNSIPGTSLKRADRQRVDNFQAILEQRKIACTVRVERGVGIAAACGQLAGKKV